MPTSIHLPEPLLSALDRRARSLKISRSRLIIRVLERELLEGSAWSPGFFERLSEVTSETAQGVEEMLGTLYASRRSKRPLEL